MTLPVAEISGFINLPFCPGLCFGPTLPALWRSNTKQRRFQQTRFSSKPQKASSFQPEEQMPTHPQRLAWWRVVLGRQERHQLGANRREKNTIYTFKCPSDSLTPLIIIVTDFYYPTNVRLIRLTSLNATLKRWKNHYLLLLIRHFAPQIQSGLVTSLC